MFVWMSGFQKSLAHTDFNMFVDEWTSANESPTLILKGSTIRSAVLAAAVKVPDGYL